MTASPRKTRPLATLSPILLVTLLAASVTMRATTGVERLPDFDRRLEPPSLDHVCGTDPAGRDVLCALLFGFSDDALVAGQTIVFSGLLGVPIGLFAAQSPRIIRHILLQCADTTLAMPFVLPGLALASLTVLSRTHIAIAIAVVWWPWYTRITLARVRFLNTAGFVEVARLIGVPTHKRLWRHYVPFVIRPVLVQASLDLGYVFVAVSTLGFFGVTAARTECELGRLMNEYRPYYADYWWLSVFPFLFVFVAIVSVVVPADGLRRRLKINA